MTDITDKILELKVDIRNKQMDYDLSNYHHIILIDKKFKKKLSEHYVKFKHNNRKYMLFGMDCIFIDSSSAVNDVEIVRRY